MRALKHITLAALAAATLAVAASAQAADSWVELAPEGESFVMRMPVQPTSQAERVEAGELKVAGRGYVAAGEDKSVYVVWSLDDSNKVGERQSGEMSYLDQIAEVAWELLIKPEVERLKSDKDTIAPIGMAYQRNLDLGGRAAREYSVRLEKARGLAYVCADGSRIYVVAALGAETQAAQLRQFVESFNFKGAPPKLPVVSTGPGMGGGMGTGTGSGMGTGTGGGIGTGEGIGSGIGPGHGSNTGGGERREGGGVTGGGDTVDYNRIFTQRDVTRKAVITAKPEPGFTESARKFSVTGVVRIRAILNRTGEVTNVSVIKGLPHGLTLKAVSAAKRVKFNPAQKDGHDVSQYILFEYNFNIY